MPFTDDIFISYRHLDNQSASSGNGWIDDFHKRLKIRLEQLLGREVRIWRDPQLQGGMDFTAEIIEHIANTKVLLTVLSPGYIESEWCLRELREFCRLAEQHGGVRRGNKFRAVKVVKTPISREKHPRALQEQTGYEFFETEEGTHIPREFSPEDGGFQHQRYEDKIYDLAWYLKELLEILDEHQPVPPPPDKERTIYLAHTTSDRSYDREKIMYELRDRGFHVLPDKEPSPNAQAYIKEVRENLKSARLSVHLIGETYGTIPDGEEEKSIIYLQNELAAERSQDPEFARLIWLPVGLTTTGERQRKFIEYLKTSGEAQKGAELLERPFEELKNRIIEKLTPPPKPSLVKQSPDSASDLIYIYLMCDKLDFDSITSIEEYLFKKGCEVILSAKEGDEGQVLQYHKENLLECDATLIYYGSANEFWLRSKLWDLKKVRGWGRARPMLSKAIYLADPETEQKKHFKTLEAKLLLPPGYSGFSEDALAQFVAEIENAREESAQTGSGGAQ
jgi:hypothetical protein